MTPFVPIPDGAQVQIVYVFDTEIVSNRLWFLDRQPPVTSAHLLDLANGVAAWHTAAVMPSLSSSITRAAVIANDWTSTPTGLVEVNTTNVVGGGSADVHSANVALRIWFQSSVEPFNLRNSNFIPGIPKDKITLNTFDAGFMSAIRDAYIDLIDLAPNFGPFPAWRWVCASSYLAGALRTEQLVRRADFIRYKKNTVAQRRKRLPPN